MSFWEKVQAGAKKAGDATKLAAQKTKLRTDMMMIDRDIQNRKQAFGVDMYDHVSPLSQSQDFYAAGDELTTIIRPPLINAQKEIQALAAKRVKLKEQLAAAEAKRAGAFPEKAETVGQKFMNFGKASAMHTGEAKIKTELAMVDRQIKGHKQKFGLEVFATLSEAEDTRGYLPNDRQVRNIYDTCRGDIHRMLANKKGKQEELERLGGNTTIAPETTVSDITPPVDNGMSAQQPVASSYADTTATPTQPTSGYSAPIHPSSGYSDNVNNSNQQMDDLLL